jgi:Kdo2-lipid IVA lauroyltransferase/acyltransferase
LRGRAARGGRLIPSDRLVELLRVLQHGGIALYSPDQRFDGAERLVVPLFGVPALSNPATTVIARATRCAVLAYFPQRLADGSGYVMTIGAPLADFPSGDRKRDLERYHALIEAAVAAAPEQYLWSYKRFRPLPGEPDPYRGGQPRGAR